MTTPDQNNALQVVMSTADLLALTASSLRAMAASSELGGFRPCIVSEVDRLDEYVEALLGALERFRAAPRGRCSVCGVGHHCGAGAADVEGEGT